MGAGGKGGFLFRHEIENILRGIDHATGMLARELPVAEVEIWRAGFRAAVDAIALGCGVQLDHENQTDSIAREWGERQVAILATVCGATASRVGICAPTLPRGSGNLAPSVPGRPAPSPEGECDAEN